MNEAVIKERDERDERAREKEKQGKEKAFQDEIKQHVKTILRFGPHIFGKRGPRARPSTPRRRLSMLSISSSTSLPQTPRSLSMPGHRTPKALKSCMKQPQRRPQARKKMIVTLFIRISSRELEQGLRARQILEQHAEQQAEQERSHVPPLTGQWGRGMRVRKAPKK